MTEQPGLWPAALDAARYPNYAAANLKAHDNKAAWLVENGNGTALLLDATGQAGMAAVGAHYYGRLDQAVKEGNASSLQLNAQISADESGGAIDQVQVYFSGPSGGSKYNTIQKDCAATITATTNAPGANAGAAGFLGSLAPWESGLASFLGAVNNANTWIRVAKIAIGGTMLIVGISKITGLDTKAPLLA